MLMRSAYCLTPLSLGMTRKAVVLHSNDIEIHTTSTGSALVVM